MMRGGWGATTRGGVWSCGANTGTGGVAVGGAGVGGAGVGGAGVGGVDGDGVIDINEFVRLMFPAANSALLAAAGTGMAVTTGGYLATLFGVFVPVVFLVTLFIQTESRKAQETGSEGDKF